LIEQIVEFIKEILTLEPITTIDLIHLVELYLIYDILGILFVLPGEALIRLLRIKKCIALKIIFGTHSIIIPIVVPLSSEVNQKKIDKIKRIKKTFINVTREEIFFRALPLIVFGSNGAIVAHVIWAGLHGLPRCLWAGVAGTLFLRLWLGGLWIQGFLIHLCHNLLILFISFLEEQIWKNKSVIT